MDKVVCEDLDLECESEWKELANNALCNVQREYMAQDDVKGLYAIESKRALTLAGVVTSTDKAAMNFIASLSTTELNTLYDALGKYICRVECVLRKKLSKNVVLDAQQLLDKLVEILTEVEVEAGQR